MWWWEEGVIAVYICTIPQESDMKYSQEIYTNFPNKAMKLYYQRA